MKLLYLAAFVPLPERDGDRVRAMTTLRALAVRHRVFGCFLDPDGAGIPAGLRALCADAVAIPLRRARLAANLLRAAAQGGLLHAGAFWWPEAQRRIAAAAARWRTTACHVHRLRMMPYAERLGLPRLFDATDCLTAYYGQALRGAGAARLSGWRRWYALRDLGRLRAAERRAVRGSAAALVTTPLERARLLAVSGGGRVLTVPNGVDAGRFAFRRRAARSRELVFLGNLGYPPNAAGLAWFLRRVAPRIGSAARLTIVGGGAGSRLRRLAAASPLPVRFTGYVPDVRPALWRAGALISPLPWASGIQNKILQAMACGAPVVATPNVAPALGAVPGREFLAAATPAAFAAGALRLLADRRFAARLARGARRLVVARHGEAATRRAMAAAVRALPR